MNCNYFIAVYWIAGVTSENSSSSLFDRSCQYAVIIPNFPQFDGVKNPCFAQKYQHLHNKLSKKPFHFNLKSIHYWHSGISNSRRSRTVSEATPSPSTARRYRGVSESSSIEPLNSYSRGFFFALPPGVQVDVKHEVVDLAKDEKSLCFWIEYEEGSKKWKLVNSNNAASEFDLELSPPRGHPVFAHPTYNHVFHSFAEVLQSLREVSH